jgi:hypothetical protein
MTRRQYGWRISRRFFQKDGVWNVEHEVLAIPDPSLSRYWFW